MRSLLWAVFAGAAVAVPTQSARAQQTWGYYGGVLTAPGRLAPAGLDGTIPLAPARAQQMMGYFGAAPAVPDTPTRVLSTYGTVPAAPGRAVRTKGADGAAPSAPGRARQTIGYADPTPAAPATTPVREVPHAGTNANFGNTGYYSKALSNFGTPGYYGEVRGYTDAPGYYGTGYGVPGYGSARTYSAFSSPYGAGYGYGYPPAQILPTRYGVGLWRPGIVTPGYVYGSSYYRTFPVPYRPMVPYSSPAFGNYAPGFGPPAFTVY